MKAIPTESGRSASRLQLAVLLAGLTALLGAAGWLIFVAGKPMPERSIKRPAAPANVIRLITFDRPFPAEGRFVADPYTGSRVSRIVTPPRVRCTRDPGTR